MSGLSFAKGRVVILALSLVSLAGRGAWASEATYLRPPYAAGMEAGQCGGFASSCEGFASNSANASEGTLRAAFRLTSDAKGVMPSDGRAWFDLSVRTSFESPHPVAGALRVVLHVQIADAQVTRWAPHPWPFYDRGGVRLVATARADCPNCASSASATIADESAESHSKPVSVEVYLSDCLQGVALPAGIVTVTAAITGGGALGSPPIPGDGALTFVSDLRVDSFEVSEVPDRHC